MQILGDTLEAIAFEKAGIIKPGVPVVIGEYLPQTRPVFEKKASETHSTIYFASDLYEANLLNVNPLVLNLAVTSLEHQITEQFQIDLPGLYQMKNLCSVLCAEGILQQLGFAIPAEAEKKALANVRQLTGFRGRWECVQVNPTVILDVAHNEDGMKQVLQQIDDAAQYHIVIGMVKDKDITKVLSLLPQNATYYFTQAHIPRALAAAELQAQAHQFNLRGDCYSDVNTAIQAALQHTQPNQTLLVCGSVFLVGEVQLPLVV
jgi:dihydrofolate synthase/folylpolyglutamate synthase